MSFRALQSLDAADDKHWLTFWLVFALFDLGCFVGDIVGWILPVSYPQTLELMLLTQVLLLSLGFINCPQTKVVQ